MGDFVAFLRVVIASRGPQLVARYVGVALTAAAAYVQASISPDAATTTSGVIASLVVAGALFVFDHISHSAQK